MRILVVYSALIFTISFFIANISVIICIHHHMGVKKWNVKMLQKSEVAIMLCSDIYEHHPVFGGDHFMRDTFFLSEATNFLWTFLPVRCTSFFSF